MDTRADVSNIIHQPVPERLKAIEDIWDSIVLESETVEVPEWHRQELRRRLDAYKLQPKNGLSWPSVREQIEERSRSRN